MNLCSKFHVILNLAAWTGEPKVDAADVFFQWEKEKHASITGFRNSSFKSIYTGHQEPRGYIRITIAFLLIFIRVAVVLWWIILNIVSTENNWLNIYPRIRHLLSQLNGLKILVRIKSFSLYYVSNREHASFVSAWGYLDRYCGVVRRFILFFHSSASTSTIQFYSFLYRETYDRVMA